MENVDPQRMTKKFTVVCLKKKKKMLHIFGHTYGTSDHSNNYLTKYLH